LLVFYLAVKHNSLWEQVGWNETFMGTGDGGRTKLSVCQLVLGLGLQ